MDEQEESVFAIISKDVQSRPPAHLIVYRSYESVRF
jgi:hypothetical protein